MQRVASDLTAEDYRAIQNFLEEQAGIRLGPGKEYLVVSRLGRLLPSFGLRGFHDLANRLADLTATPLLPAVVDAMTTNETFWFRDQGHFRMLTNGILSESRPADLRIWSAAASTGQEAYTAAISLQEAMQDGRLDRSLSYQIIGTDISPSALQQAQRAVYCGVAASRGLSDEQRRRYFREHEACVELLPKYREQVRFHEFNLLKPFDVLGRFDVVFCRNVLIYFSQERKNDIVKRLARALKPGGHLFLGSTESIRGHEDLFELRHFAGSLAYRLRS